MCHPLFVFFFVDALLSFFIIRSKIQEICFFYSFMSEFDTVYYLELSKFLKYVYEFNYQILFTYVIYKYQICFCIFNFFKFFKQNGVQTQLTNLNNESREKHEIKCLFQLFLQYFTKHLTLPLSVKDNHCKGQIYTLLGCRHTVQEVKFVTLVV